MLNKKNRQTKLVNRADIALLLKICFLSVLSFTVNADDISTPKGTMSADEFLNALTGDDSEATINNMGTSPENSVRFRGISLKKSTPKPVKSPTQDDEQTFNQQVSANQVVNACLAKKQSVAVNITFTPNSSNVKDTGLIENIAKAMNNSQLSNCYFIIEGHTDAVGNEYYNLWLSQKRAGEVKQHLSQNDVSADRLVVVGKGEDELLNSEIPNAAENRRVVFKVINFKN